MIEQSLFNIPYYTTPILDFKVKKKKLVNLLKSYPEKKHGMQTFFTNRQSNRDGLVEGFTELISKELNMSQRSVIKAYSSAIVKQLNISVCSRCKRH